MKRTRFTPARRVTVAAGLLAAILASACQPGTATVVPTRIPPTATPIPPTATALPPAINLPYTPVPLSVVSPIVIQHTPETGERLNPAGAIQIVFDRAMDQKSVEAAFRTQPAVKGSFAWADARTLSFQPAAALPRNTIMDVALTQEARAADGAALRNPYQFRFATQGNLEVGQTIPAGGTSDAYPDTIITVLFNHPVVPLTTLNEQSSLPQPLSFDPPIAGKAEWLNTSILVFRPEQPLPGGTTYTGRIAASLKDTDGNPLATDYTWTFGTAAPKVLSVSPAQTNRPARIDAAVRAVFNQNVDPASAIGAFALLDSDGRPVDGQAVVLSDTLIFTPSSRLAFDAAYTIRIASGVRSAGGGNGSAQAWNSTFRTVPLPKVIATQPADGARGVPPGTSFTIRFNTDVDPATIMAHFRMTPEISPTRAFSYYNAYNHSFTIYFGAEAATDYVAHITPGIADPYGNLTEQSLRVAFRTGDLPPSAYINVPYGAVTLNAYLPAQLAATAVNISRLDFQLSAFSAKDAGFLLRDANGLAAAARQPVRSWRQTVQGPPNRATHVLVNLAPDGGRLAPGAYYLIATSPDIPQERFHQEIVVIVSEINLTLKHATAGALVWANDMQTGKPVANLAVRFYGVRYSQRLETFAIGNGNTDASGVAQIAIPASTNSSGEILAIADGRFSAVSSSWSGGISVYNFSLPSIRGYGYYGGGAGLRAYIYTDRPIYRPGQVVYLRGIVRNEDDVKYTLPPAGLAVQLRVDDAQGQNILDTLLPADQYGAFNAVVKLADGAPLGSYNVSAAAESSGIAYMQFTVSAYRPPEYEATVTPAAAEIVRGGILTATVNAHYLSGGALANAPVQWNAVARSTTFNPPQFDQYTFSDSDNPWYCYVCWRYPGYQPPIQPLYRGNGMTDDQGRLELSLPISLELRGAGGALITGPLELSIEANVSGADNQIIAGRSSVTVHPATYYVGIAFPEYLIKAGQTATVELVALGWQAARLAGKSIEVSVFRREWKNTYDETTGRWSYQTSDVPVTTASVTSDARGEAIATFTPPQAGTYRVVARGRDDQGRLVQSSRFIWATGSEFIPWMRENNDRINLISDRNAYRPGDTAEIMIPSPFSGEHYALVTVERGHILRHEVIPVHSSSTVYRLPLTARDAPNIYVSVVLFAGMAPGGAAASQPGAPAGRADYKVGYINLDVAPVTQVFSITLTPDRSLVQPGETVNYTLQATDSNGGPVVGQFSLDLVDKGILNLMPREKDAIVQAFYGERGASVQTASGLSVSGNRIVEEAQQLAQRDAFALSAGAAPTSAPAATAAPGAAAAPKAAPAARPPGANNAPQIRENFADTAFWTPAITTDAGGKASVSIKLPDNLTTWVLRAVGVDADTRVGEATVNVVATKPLLIRPVTPRFVVAGDVVELGAVVNNNTGAPQAAVVALSQADGVTLTTPLSQVVTIPAQGETSVKWTARVGDVDSVNLVFSVSNDQYSDASRPRLSTAPGGGLKVNHYSAPEVIGTAGELDRGGSRTEIVALPPRLDASQGALTVRLDPSLAASMQAGLTYLENYPYDSADAVAARFLPNVLNYRALREFAPGSRDAALEAKLQSLVSDSLNKLYGLQHGDGGWGWWNNLESSPHVSAWIVFGLLRARDAGFNVSADTLQRGLAYLQGTLRETANLNQYYEYNLQAFVLYVLGEGGRGDTARVSQLYDARDKLSLYARALLALAIGRADKQDARLKTLFADLNGKVIQSATGAHWEEQYVDWWAMNTDTRSTAIILSAMAQLDPSSALAPNVVRWLMVSRTNGIWNTTQETAWALIALTDWARATGELRADYEYTALLNDRGIASGRATAQTITRTTTVETPIAALLRDTGNRLTILRGDGPGRLYYSAHLKAYLPVPSIKAIDRGITVLRRYTLASCADGVKCPQVTSARVGDVIRVNLTLVAPGELYYLQLEDPIPAGAEIVDTGLATTSQLAEGPALRRNAARARPYIWWWHWYSRSELRDDRVALFARYLSKGTYEYSYTFRATSAGQFNVIPTFVNEQYFPEVFGRSDGALFTIGDK